MMIIKTIIPPTTHVQGWTVKEDEVVLVVDVVEETALSWATAMPAKNNDKIIVIHALYKLLMFFIAFFLNTKK